MTGRDTGRGFKLGQKIRVLVYDVDRTAKTIDFVLAEEEDEDEQVWQRKK
jgi:exoribonuclease R